MTALDVKEYKQSFGLVEYFSDEGPLHIRLADKRESVKTKFSACLIHKIDGNIAIHHKECKRPHVAITYELDEYGTIIDIHCSGVEYNLRYVFVGRFK